jgi:ferritin
VDAGAQVRIPAVPGPKADFKTAEEAVKLSLEWELTVTKQINELVDLAINDKDHLTRNFLQWFVSEQLEEVASMETLLSIVRRAGEGGLLFVEDFLARRGVTLPSGTAAGEDAT